MQKGPDIGERIATLANPLGNHKTPESQKKYTSALEAELAERIGTVDKFGSSEIIAFTTIKRLSNTNNQELEIALAAIYRLSTIRNIPQNIRASLLTGKAREIAGIISKDKQDRTKYALISYHLDKGQLIVDRVAQTLRLDPINIQIFKKINDSTLVDKHQLPDFVTEDIAQTNYARHLERIYHQILSQRPTKR